MNACCFLKLLYGLLLKLKACYSLVTKVDFLHTWEYKVAIIISIAEWWSTRFLRSPSCCHYFLATRHHIKNSQKSSEDWLHCVSFIKPSTFFNVIHIIPYNLHFIVWLKYHTNTMELRCMYYVVISVYDYYILDFLF